MTHPISEVEIRYECPDCGRRLLAAWRRGWSAVVEIRGAAVAHVVEEDNVQGKQIERVRRQEVIELFETGEPGAEPITQFIDGEFVTFWVPTLNDIPVSAKELEKFDTSEEATARATELKRPGQGNSATTGELIVEQTTGATS